jgi:peptidoglycan/LPS O-acetylase OafA/YrhL
VRGIAILLVFLFHAWGITMGKADGPIPFWLGYVVAGNTGVTLFFVLSGFLLSLPWLRSGRGEADRPRIRNYYMARVLRILPLYLFTVALASVASGNWEAGLRAAVFQFVGFEMFPYSVVWWTLVTEVQFYLVLPLFWLAWLHPGWPRRMAKLALAAWLVTYIWLFVYPGLDAEPGPYWLTKSLFGRLPAFLLGMVAAQVYLVWRDRWRHRGAAWLGLAALVVAWLVLGWLLQQVVAMGEARAEWAWHLHHSWEALCWSVVILAILLVPLPGRAVLLNRPLAVLGKLSYSLYLNHVPVLFFLIYTARTRLGESTYTETAWVFIVPLLGLALSLLLAFITYRWIELPFLNLKHRLPP